MTTRIVIVSDPQEAGELAADVIERAVARAETEQRDAVLGFATGSTPVPVYRALAERSIDLSRAWGFALDDYLGLPGDHPQSYGAVIERDVIMPLGLDPVRVMIPGDGPASTPDSSPRTDFEAAIAAVGGVDVQLLGIGSNGHLAFNEPGSPFDSLTRVVQLAEQTRRDNARFFGSLDEVPTRAITQGLGTIARARTLVLLAFGEVKAVPLAAALDGPVSEQVPASILQLHPDALVLADDAAASLLHRDAGVREWVRPLSQR